MIHNNTVHVEEDTKFYPGEEDSVRFTIKVLTDKALKDTEGKRIRKIQIDITYEEDT